MAWYNTVRHFKKPDGTIYETARSFWYTNLDIAKRHEKIILYRTYESKEDEYPVYDNYDAINVDKTKDIPSDFNGVIGGQLHSLDKYNPKQFVIMECHLLLLYVKNSRYTIMGTQVCQAFN